MAQIPSRHPPPARAAQLPADGVAGQVSLEMLQWLGRSISGISSVEELSDLVPPLVDHVAEIEMLGLYLLDFDHGTLQLLAHRGLTGDEAALASATAMDRHPGEVVRTGAPFRSDDVRRGEGRFAELWDFPRLREPRSRLYFPVLRGDRCVGCFGIASTEPEAFGPQHEALLSFTCDLIGVLWGKLETEVRRASLDARLGRAERAAGASRQAEGISHDLNNALTVLLAQVDDLDEITVGERPQALINAMRATCREAGRVSRRLVPGRRAPGRRRTVDLVTEVRRICTPLRETLGAERELRLTLPEGQVGVACEGADLDQLLLNLIANARDALRGPGEVHVELAVAGDEARLSVTDDGIGMEPDVARVAFEPFFTTKEPGEGVGLGLSAVRDLASTNGWTVDFDSGFGRGTRVEIGMPLSDAVPLVVGDPATEPMLDVTVLLVEDDDSIRAVVERRLRQFVARVARPRMASRPSRPCTRGCDRTWCSPTSSCRTAAQGP